MRNRLMLHWSVKADRPCVLNLDPHFNPIQGSFYDLEVEKFEFNGGEPHLRIKTEVEHATELVITQRCQDSADFLQILLANDAARRMGFTQIKLVLPCFPGARQDRVCNPGEPLTARVFADLINSCGFDQVIILVPHSEVVPALVNNVVLIDEMPIIESALKIACPGPNDSAVNIVCPDAGAGKRVSAIAKHLANRFPHNTVNFIRCEKVRDVKTGALKEFVVHASDLKRLPTLIIDDINSMGGTFIGLGEVLRQRNCGRLMLYTAHADCPEGIQRIIENFDHYFVTNSKRDWDKYTYTFPDRLTCLPIHL